MPMLRLNGLNARRTGIGVGLTITLFLMLLAAAMVLLLAANRDFGRQSVERQAAQASSVLQAWVNVGNIRDTLPGPDVSMPPPPRLDPKSDLPDVMERILGFTVFGTRGQAVFSWGEAVPPPERILGGAYELSPQPFGDVVAWGRSSTVLYIKTEPGLPRMRMMRMLGPGERDRIDPARGPGQTGPLLVLSFDGTEALGVMRMRQVLIVLLGCAALGLVAALLLLFRRVGSLQSDLEEQRALARLGTAARTLAHEVRNPLSIILMQAKLLERQLGDGHGDGLQSICEEANRIELQVRNVRRILGQDKPIPESPEKPAFVGSPKPWLDSLRAGFPAWDGKINITGFSAGSSLLAPAIADEQLRSIVVNLVDNALEALASRPAAAVGETVDIEWEIRGGRKPALRLSVLDRAGGVRRNLRRRIFDPFFTTKPNGSGVGLNLARELARVAGGELEYRFEKPAGSRFLLILPLFSVSAQNGDSSA